MSSFNRGAAGGGTSQSDYFESESNYTAGGDSHRGPACPSGTDVPMSSPRHVAKLNDSRKALATSEKRGPLDPPV
jgi:hypothetical protein